MRCFDTTFLVDYARADEGAVEAARKWLDAGERMTTPAVAAAEALVGAHYRGGKELARFLEFLELLDIIPFEAAEAAEAGLIGAEALRRGEPLLGIDLLIAATARHHRGILVSRDKGFSSVAGLAVESY